LEDVGVEEGGDDDEGEETVDDYAKFICYFSFVVLVRRYLHGFIIVYRFDGG
jgi:hypothetical protein